jgi:hypothetical protein
MFRDPVARNRVSVLAAFFLAFLVLVAWILGAVSPVPA